MLHILSHKYAYSKRSLVNYTNKINNLNYTQITIESHPLRHYPDDFLLVIFTYPLVN